MRQAARDPDEEGDFMAFEQLMAEAQIKKEKKKKKDPPPVPKSTSENGQWSGNTEFTETWEREKK
jgi:hypothetical protein